MPRTRDVDAILARFPGPVTLHPSRRKWIGTLAIGLGFVAIGIFILNSKSGEVGPEEVFMAWVGLVFFGLAMLVSVVMLLPGAGGLTLTADGFEVTSLFRRSHTAWTSVSGFTVAHLAPAGTPFAKGHGMVAYDLVNSPGALSDLNRGIIGRNAALPDTYGFTREELARLMSNWRERALTRPSPVPRIRSS